MSRLPLGPVGIVGMPRSEVMLDPWNAHEIERGGPPCSRCKKLGQLGRRCGGSGRNNYWYELEKRFEEELYVPFWTPISIKLPFTLNWTVSLLTPAWFETLQV